MKKHQKPGLVALLLCALYLPVHAAPSFVNTYLSDPQLVGEARLKVMLWNVFDASLYANAGTYNAAKPFALSLRYLRALDGSRIVAKSMEEIKRQQANNPSEQLALWERELLRIIPDVEKGTVITGIRTEQGYTAFYLGDEKLGNINNAAFTEAFFGIWLSEKTSEPQFRSKLIGSRQNT